MQNGREYSTMAPLLFGGLIIIPNIASANAGLPMLMVFAPVLIISIVPIILIEAWYLARKLTLNKVRAVKVAATANLISSIAGIPITWALLVVIQILTGGSRAYGLGTLWKKLLAVTWQAPWLIPYEEDFHWMIPVAMLILMIPFFFASWWTEYVVARLMLKEIDPREINRYMLNANTLTYALLMFWPIIMLLVPEASIF